MDPASLALLAGGASTLLGGLFGSKGASEQAKAQNAAAQQSLNLFQNQTGGMQEMLMSFLLGSDNARRLLGSSGGGVPTGQIKASAADDPGTLEEFRAANPGLFASRGPFSGGFGGPMGGIKAYQDAKNAFEHAQGVERTNAAKSQARDEKFSEFGEVMKNLGLGDSGIFGGMQDITKMGDRRGKELLAGYNQRANAANSQFDAMGRSIQQNINDQTTRLRDDVGLRTAGLGGAGSMGLNMMRGVSERMGRVAGDAFANLGQMRGNFMQGVNQGATNIQSAVDSQFLNNKALPMNMVMQMLQGNALNPFLSLGSGVGNFFPGASPGGSAMSLMGNALGGLGGAGLGAGFELLGR